MGAYQTLRAETLWTLLQNISRVFFIYSRSTDYPKWSLEIQVCVCVLSEKEKEAPAKTAPLVVRMVFYLKTPTWGPKFQGRVILKDKSLPGIVRLSSEWVFTKNHGIPGFGSTNRNNRKK